MIGFANTKVSSDTAIPAHRDDTRQVGLAEKSIAADIEDSVTINGVKSDRRLERDLLSKA